MALDNLMILIIKLEGEKDQTYIAMIFPAILNRNHFNLQTAELV